MDGVKFDTVGGMLKIAIVSVALALVGCATPYQSMGWLRGGYKSTRLSHGHHSVHVRVNQAAGSGAAFNYANRRAQELCVADGFTSFVIETGSQDTRYGVVNGRIYSKPEITVLVRCINR